MKYYHDRGLSFPWCKPKCSRDGCNESKKQDHPEGLCVECNYKDMCVGDLKCPGWMSVPCNYDGKTVVGDTCCQKCCDDGRAWAEEGVRVCGPGGWFGNDNT